MRTAALAGVLAIMAALIPSPSWAYAPRALVRLNTSVFQDVFAHSVSDAGDVNGDGYADVIIGAPFADTGGTDRGAAYVYYGGPEADAVADLTLVGAAANDQFGISVSGAGDVNGDGYDDMIVGADMSDIPLPDCGRAYIFYGGANPNSVADLTLSGNTAGDSFGWSVSGAGDVNGDGFADVIVGAYLNDAAGVDAGRAYVYYGGAAPNSVVDLTLTGAAAGNFFGISVSGAGDYNKDGFADLIVGAPYNSIAEGNAGRAYLYYGGASANSVADVEFWFSEVQANLGFSVSDAGDVNADGYADVIVGSPGHNAGAGRAYVYFGGTGGDYLFDMALPGAPGDQLGTSVSGAGDVNADGYDDVVVGAVGSNVGTNEGAGSVLVYYGGPAPDPVADLVQPGASTAEAFGNAVSGAGDVNGDGYADFIGATIKAFFEGKALVMTSRAYDLETPNGGEQWVVGSQQNVSWLGSNPADLWLSSDGGLTYTLLASDVGGLDRNEFSITVPAVPTSTAKVRLSIAGEPLTHATSYVSETFFYIVPPHDPPAAAHRLQRIFAGANSEDALGASVSDAGDVNGDGYADVIVGAHGNDAGGSDAGRAYVHYGGPAADAIADLTLTGQTAGDNFGISVSGAGDVNGDGYADVIVGAWANSAGASNGGRAYLYFGGPGADAVADLILTGTEPFGSFGFAVSGAGDVNGDGYSDFVVGAFGQNAGAGRAYVYFGGIALDAGADLILTGGAAGDSFGQSVSAAGDVNGDGYADVIVGAHANGAGASGAGRAYVYYGGPGADASVDVTLAGAAASDAFGYSVSGAGDVNGDSFADVIVGAPVHDSGATDAGRAYVFLGGRMMDNVADLTLTGQSASEQLGVSVSGAGDVNGDGFADVIAGANGNDALGLDTGRAYVYYGGPGADAVADHVLTGPFDGSLFGISVSGAGDGNGDGHGDVIVGAVAAVPGGLPGAGQADLYDLNRYHLTAPNGGETWNVGSRKAVSWIGAEPAQLWLSVDGGQSYTPLTPSAVGGSSSNSITIQVPHSPTKFAKIQVTPFDPNVGGFDRSDSLFTVQTSVALLAMLAAPLPEGAKGATISWQTDPGPDDLAGYRLERGGSGSGDWRTLVALTRETSVTDPDGGPGSKYRLYAVNGLGEELWLGEAAIRPLKPLAAWPLPYRGGALNVSFATAGGLGGGAGRADLSVYDVSGRLVRRIDSGTYPSGYRLATWDGKDERGRGVAPGVYFLRMTGDLGYQRTMKISVLR